MKPTLFVASLLACCSPLVHAAGSDYLLKLDGIPGESRDERLAGTIEVISFSWGVSNPSSTTAGGGGAGKATFQDFHFVCSHDKSSPLLMLACAQGQHIPTATLYVRKPSSDPTGGLPQQNTCKLP
jgi:type VI secretion system secreted protein Hcp